MIQEILDIISLYPMFIYDNGRGIMYFSKPFVELSNKSLDITTYGNSAANICDSTQSWLLTINLQKQGGLLTSSTHNLSDEFHYGMYDNGIDVLINGDCASIKRKWTIKEIIG